MALPWPLLPGPSDISTFPPRTDPPLALEAELPIPRPEARARAVPLVVPLTFEPLDRPDPTAVPVVVVVDCDAVVL